VSQARKLGLGGLLALLVGTALWGYFSIGALVHTLIDIVEVHNPSHLALVNVNNQIRQSHAGLGQYLAQGGHAAVDPAAALVPLTGALGHLTPLLKQRESHLRGHRASEHAAMTEAGGQAVASLRTAIDRAHTALPDLDLQRRKGVAGSDLRSAEDRVEEAWRDIALALSNANKALGSHSELMQRASITEGRRRQQEFLALALLSLLIAAVISITFTRYVRARLRPVRIGAQKLFDGDLSHRIPEGVSDELGDLARVFNRMAEGLESKEQDLLARVAELREVNREVQTSNAYLDGVIDSIPDPLFVVDGQKRISRANPAALALTGHGDSELPGTPLARVLTVDPTGLERDAGGRVAAAEAELVTRTGEHVPVQLSAARSECGGEGGAGEIVIVQDIRSAKWAERRREMKYAVTRALVGADGLEDVMPEILEALGVALDCACGSYWEWSPEQELLLHRQTWGDGPAALTAFLDCQSTNDPSSPGGLIRRTWNTGQFAWIDDVGQESNFQRAPYARAAGLRGGIAFPVWDGATTYGVLELFSLRSLPPEPELVEDCQSAGQQIAQFCRRRSAEAALREKTERLERSNHELDQFAYVTSHDLKAPLRAIANLATWIEEDLGDDVTEEIGENIELLRGRVNRMEALIQGILDYSRIGRETVSAEPVNLSELLPEVIDSLPVPSGFEINVKNPMPVLRAPKVRLTQVFANLIGNAIKYHDRPPGRVDMSVTNGGRWYEFSIEDDGPGIPEEYHDRVFGIFQTLEARDKVESTGIGLTLVKKIVEEQGGHIGIAPREGRGTCFRFTWPAEAQKQ
jgi:PAS domain S-box-containing protein